MTPALRAVVFAAGAAPFVALLAPWSAGTLSQVLSTLCHQLPERTLTVGGVAMVVCSRCAGVYAGVMLGALWPMPVPLFARLRPLLIAVAALAVLDVALQDLHLLPVGHARRVVTGLLLGWAPAAAMSRALSRPSEAPRAELA
ncbi:MAG: DUF2085 domain-containing protein [Polyangiaceae bacterium]|nr:DUF2085 domain-containing protein [Polyangiaceae bacterium]